MSDYYMQNVYDIDSS